MDRGAQTPRAAGANGIRHGLGRDARTAHRYVELNRPAVGHCEQCLLGTGALALARHRAGESNRLGRPARLEAGLPQACLDEHPAAVGQDFGIGWDGRGSGACSLRRSLCECRRREGWRRWQVIQARKRDQGEVARHRSSAHLRGGAGDQGHDARGSSLPWLGRDPLEALLRRCLSRDFQLDGLWRFHGEGGGRRRGFRQLGRGNRRWRLLCADRVPAQPDRQANAGKGGGIGSKRRDLGRTNLRHPVPDSRLDAPLRLDLLLEAAAKRCQGRCLVIQGQLESGFPAQLVLDRSQLYVQVGRPALALGARRQVRLKLRAQAVLDRNQQVLGGQVEREQLGLGRQALAQRGELLWPRGRRGQRLADGSCSQDEALLHVDQAGLAVDALRHVPAKPAVPQFAVSVEEQLFWT